MRVLWAVLIALSVISSPAPSRAGVEPKRAKAGPLWVDIEPVTNADYLEFVKAEPRWQKSRVSRLFAEKEYLSEWTGDVAFPDSMGRKPVVRVSWFAARAYCRWTGARLPTLREWEAFSESSSEKSLQTITDWYSRASSSLREVGGDANRFGIKDTHGLVWEWIEDFTQIVLPGDMKTCGKTEAPTVKEKAAYIEYMRAAHWSSVQGKFTTANLGFRCVKDAAPTENSKTK